MLLRINQSLFLLINAPPHANLVLVDIARILAEGSAPFAALALTGLWMRCDRVRRTALLNATTAALVALGVNQILGLVWFEPRPFMAGVGRTLLAHAADNSFPSDHATLMWTLGWTLFLTKPTRGLGLLFVTLGFFVAWARIFLGLHFPIDMAGSMIVSLAISIPARRLSAPIGGWIQPPIERLYEAVCRRLGLAKLLAASFRS